MIAAIDMDKVNQEARAKRALRLAVEGCLVLSPQDWYDLTLLVSGDKSLAEDAHLKALKRQLLRP